MDKNDENDTDIDKGSLFGLISRVAKVSGTGIGLAGKLAGQKYFGREIDQPEHAKALTAALGGLKGPLLKVAQLLATIPQALPKEYAQELQQLQSDAPPMGWPFVKRRMRAELGADWQSKFGDFSKTAIAAASLGQVHQATALDGQKLACKLQYPDMTTAVKADLGQLKLILSIFEKYDKTINTEDIFAELKERLFEELDYTREAKHTRLYHHVLQDEANVHIPNVITDLSTDRLLTSTWVEGKRIMTFKDAPAEQRAEIALNMFRAWYVPFYKYGLIHGDPHFGNYSVRDDNSVNVLDFGCVRIFPPSFVKGVIDLYHALLTDDKDLAAHAYQSWGFENLSNELLEVLNIWARFLYGPILEDRIRPIGVVQDGGGVYGRETAEQVHKALRDAGGVRVPREFVFMDRAALGLGSVFIHLRAELNWYQVFQGLTDGFDMNQLTARQDDALSKFDLL